MLDLESVILDTIDKLFSVKPVQNRQNRTSLSQKRIQNGTIFGFFFENFDYLKY